MRVRGGGAGVVIEELVVVHGLELGALVQRQHDDAADAEEYPGGLGYAMDAPKLQGLHPVVQKEECSVQLPNSDCRLVLKPHECLKKAITGSLVRIEFCDLNMTAKMKATTGTMLKMADEEVAEAYFRPMQYKLIVPAILSNREQTAWCFRDKNRKLAAVCFS